MRAAGDLDSEIFLGGTCFRTSDFPLRKMGHAEACPSDQELLRWRFFPGQRLLPIEDEFPRTRGVRLPDMKVVALLRLFIAHAGIFSVGVGEIGGTAHVAAHRLKRCLAPPVTEQTAPRLFPFRREMAIAIYSDLIRRDGQRRLGRVVSGLIVKFLLRFPQVLASSLYVWRRSGRAVRAGFEWIRMAPLVSNFRSRNRAQLSTNRPSVFSKWK